MLTAAIAEVAPPGSPGNLSNLEAEIQLISLATPTEGGYIQLNGQPTGLVLDSDALLTPAALRDLIANGTLSSDGTFNADDSTSGGIRPVAIISNSGGSFQFIPIHAEWEYPAIGTSEGGPIAIATVLEETTGETEQMGEGSATELIGEFSGAKRAKQRSTDSPTESDAMSGELERAIMFEMAGGDPVEIEQPTTRDGTYNQNWVDDAPLFLRSTQPPGAGHSPREMAESGAHESSASVSRDLTVAALEYHGDIHEQSNGHTSQAEPAAAVPEIFAERSHSQMSTRAVHSHTDSDSAHEQAFNQLGVSEKSVIYDVAHGSARRGLDAVPLLTLLALERVAARNSRRANKLPSVAGPCPPDPEVNQNYAGG